MLGPGSVGVTIKNNVTLDLLQLAHNILHSISIKLSKSQGDVDEYKAIQQKVIVVATVNLIKILLAVNFLLNQK